MPGACAQPLTAVTPACPRCGYDLSGHIAAWTDSCPLWSECSECGLAVRWGEFIAQIRSGPAWSFEHGPRPWSPRRLAITLALTLAPWMLVRRLTMAHEIRRRRVAAVALASLLAVHLAAAAAVIANQRAPFGGAFYRREPVVLVLLWPYNRWIAVRNHGDSEILGAFVVFMMIAWAAQALSALVLGDTFRAARIRRAHLLRAAAYSILPIGLVAIALPFALLAGESLAPAWAEHWAAGSIVLSIPLWVAAWWWFFVGGYLRLRAWLIVPVLTVIAWLGTACAVVLLTLWLRAS